MLIDRRVVFMFAAPDISILANWFYIYYLAKLLQKSEMRKDIVIELSYKGFG